MLKKAMVGGPSIVFYRHHKAGVTQIRPHRFAKTKTCRRIIGYDANALYPSTMMREMPCGKEKVVTFENTQEAVQGFVNSLAAKAWFGFAEVDIEIPQWLWMKFEEMPPFFYTTTIADAEVPEHMKEYMARTGRKRGHGKKLVGALSAQKLLLYELLLQWYLSHGAKITAVYRTINYQPTRALKWFVDEVTEAWRTGDTDKSKALLADIFKLLGNSSFGKMIECLERQTSGLHERREARRPRAQERVFRGPGRDRRGVRAGKQEAMDIDKPPVPDRHSGVPAGEAEDARVLLRLPRPVRPQARLRADPDGYGQQLHGDFG